MRWPKKKADVWFHLAYYVTGEPEAYLPELTATLRASDLSTMSAHDTFAFGVLLKQLP